MPLCMTSFAPARSCIMRNLLRFRRCRPCWESLREPRPRRTGFPGSRQGQQRPFRTTSFSFALPRPTTSADSHLPRPSRVASALLNTLALPLPLPPKHTHIPHTPSKWPPNFPHMSEVPNLPQPESASDRLLRRPRVPPRPAPRPCGTRGLPRHPSLSDVTTTILPMPQRVNISNPKTRTPSTP